ncbi:MAG: GDP-mannose 4,6-dehydratase [Candidatus Omnitrophica bacterium]|nr:GDP-mannose 4,6-dehydratase [Candidatus Omnitrophota bacterium]
MNVLVTGAAGLYGVHLVDELVKDKNVSHVYGIDDFSREFLTVKPPHKNNESNFAVLRRNSNGAVFAVSCDKLANEFKVIDPFIHSAELDEKFTLICDRYQNLSVEQLDEMGIDTVIHLAAYISIPESMHRSEEYFLNNEYGPFQLMQKLRKTKNQPLMIYASSPEVYGDPIYTPMDINHPMYPKSIYATTKLAAEKHCRSLYEWYKYPVVIIRNFNTFGENQNIYGDAAVVSNFIFKALKKEPLIIHNTGQQTRDFQYVKDAVRAYHLVAGRKDLAGSIFNIGTGIQTQIKTLAEKILKLSGSESEIKYESGRGADLIALEADYSEIGKKVGWKPNFSLDEGLKRTIEWYKRVLGV